MKTFITNVKKMEFGEAYEVRCYEHGTWQHDTYVEDIEEAIERMNFLMNEYDFKDDEVELIKLQYYTNVVDILPF